MEVEWLTQSPVTDFLEQRGETVHPASAFLASESTHIESESGEHDLHAFQAIRRMDEVLVNNFMVFDDLVSRESFDLWVGDEAWDLDHFLHENPELKRAPFVWMTDFVGWMPMADGGEREAFLAADYNAEMVEHVARFPSLRDRSVFVGDPADVVDVPLGPNLPNVREWTKEHFEFTGYVMGQRPDPLERTALRARLGYADSDVVCLVSVGGSGVGTHLLRRVAASYDEARRRIPNLRMVVVTGPRIDPASIAAPAGVEVHGFLPDLDLHHAACDIAVVQGGLSTTMELTASGRPFLYFPLGHHFEQQVHVRHRLERHGAGRCMDYRDADPSRIADALVEELGRPLVLRPGADRRRLPGSSAGGRADLTQLRVDQLAHRRPGAVHCLAQGRQGTSRALEVAALLGRAGDLEVAVRSRHPGLPRRALDGFEQASGLDERVLPGGSSGGREGREATQAPGFRRPRTGHLQSPAGQGLCLCASPRPPAGCTTSSPAAAAYHQGWSTGEVSATAVRPRAIAVSRSPASRAYQPRWARK